MKKILLLLLLGIVYVTVSELAAKKKAEAFCDSVNIGGATTNLREQAIAAGARARASQWQKNGADSRRIFVTFTGYYPGSDFICLIYERNGNVIEKKSQLISSLLTP